MNFIVRFSTQKDMTSVHDLITELAIFEKEPNAVEISVNDLIRDGFGEHPKFQVLVAESDEKIVGMALFYERYSTWKGKAIHLEDLIVTQHLRGKGIGKALYTELMRYALNNNFKRVAWEVLDWNQGAVDFYTQTGATVYDEWRVVHMKEEHLTEFVRREL